MHYYYHNIKDFRAGCHNMESRLERWIYRDMIDAYYDREAPFPDDIKQICAILGLRREEEREIVAGLLVLKFEQTERGWVHERCEEEIAKYHANAEVARLNGQRGGRPKGSKKPSGFPSGSSLVPGGLPSGSHPEPAGGQTAPTPKANQEPITNNQEPDKKHKAPAAADAELFPGVDPQVIADFKAIRKQKRAPVTLTAMQTIQREAEKARMTLDDALRVCCARGWQGFKAEWITQHASHNGDAGHPSLGKHGQATAANAMAWLEEHP